MKYTPKQTQTNRKRLSDALRSGKYKKHKKGVINVNLTNVNKTTFCAFGVACDVSGLGEWKDNWFMGTFYTYHIDDRDYTNLLPDEVKDWLGFSNIFGGFVDENRNPTSLDSIDWAGATFSEIADLIDSEPVGLITV